MQLTVPEASNEAVLQILTLGESDLLENLLKTTPDSPDAAQVVDARAHAEVNHFAVMGQIIGRYSAMITSALESMAGMFTFSEVIRMVNANPTTYWKDDDIASVFVDDLGGVELLTASAPEEILNLANKLARLSMPQRIALVDVIERVFRGLGGISDIGPSPRELIQTAGLVLKEVD